MNPCVKTGADVMLQYESGNMKLHGDLYVVGDCIVLRYNPHTLEPAPTDDPDYNWAHAIFACGQADENAVLKSEEAPDILNLEGAGVLIMRDIACLMHRTLLEDINEAMGRPRDWNPVPSIEFNVAFHHIGDDEDDDGETRH